MAEEITLLVYSTEQLGSEHPGVSGASRIGLAPVAGLSAPNLQAAVEKLADNLTPLPDYGYRYATAAQDVINAQDVPLDFGGGGSRGVRWDPAARALVIARSGLYSVSCGVSWVPNATGMRSFQLKLNGTAPANTLAADERGATAAPFETRQAIAVTAVPLAAEDRILATAFQTSGAALRTEMFGRSTFLSVSYVGPA